MGCGGSRTKLEGNDSPIEHWIEKTGIEDIDKAYEEVVSHLTNVEEIRSYAVDELEELAVQTGACAFKEINLEKCYIAFFMNAEVESEEYYKKISASDSAPHFTGPELKKNKKSYEALTEYIKKWDTIKTKNDVKEKLEQLQSELKSREGEYEKTINEKFKDKPGQA
jgi:hypothetical protein